MRRIGNGKRHGIPLGIRVTRSGKSIGTGLTLVIITVYYFLLIGSIIISEKGLVPSRYAMWTSNLLVLVPAVILNFRLLKK